ncbi:MAG: hypothetical protein KGI78_02240 [Patescibacteria group bacterium]|nr:hypothetical protein [Patescibacteria group bacterium]MDE1944519.1 hypothetical protein [Patescibacteria group bacterium]MDE1945370.1 hypothetical protein [Patescibacteria group bacterium]MDE2057653.1 hypothetical protein [Patescibacteria group bacterium]
MKEMTCSEMGGPADCTTVLRGETADEMVKAGWDHIQAAHPEMAEGIKNNPKEVNDKWQEEFRATFDALPDAPAEAG